MKNKPILAAALLLCLAAQAEPLPRAGTFKRIEGTVTATRQAETRAVKPGDAVYAHDLVRTVAGAAASLTLRDGTELVLGPNAELRVDDFAFDATTEEGHVLLALLHGSLRMVSGLIAKLRPEAATVKTPTLVIGLRGTDFIAEAP